MDKPYFIMVYLQNGKGVVPIVDDDENVLMFERYDEAKALADDHPLCLAFDYEVMSTEQPCEEESP